MEGRTHSTFVIPRHSMSFAVITHYASAGMQHQFCRLDHVCKECSCGPLWQKGTTEPATNYATSEQIPPPMYTYGLRAGQNGGVLHTVLCDHFM